MRLLAAGELGHAESRERKGSIGKRIKMLLSCRSVSSMLLELSEAGDGPKR